MSQDSTRKTTKYLDLFQSDDPVAECGCGESPLLHSHMDVDILSFRLYCPNCGIETPLCPRCEDAVALWNIAMKRHKRSEWCGYYDRRGDNLATELDKVEAAIEQNNSEEDESVIDRLAGYINSKMPGSSITEYYRKKIRVYVQKYSYDAIVKAINISAKQYLVHEGDAVTGDSADNFLNKIGGILHNLHLSPVDKEVSHTKSLARQQFGYFNESIGNSLMRRYVDALKNAYYSEEGIIKDLQTEMKRLIYESSSWSSWRRSVEGWIDELNGNDP